MHRETSFEELKKTWKSKKALLKGFAEALGWNIFERITSDGWDIEVTLQSREDNAMSYTSVGSMRPFVYDDLLNLVMHNYRWKTVEEMKVWIDLHVVNSSSTCHSECCLKSTASQSSAV